MSEKFIAIQAVVRIDATTFDEREAFDARVMKALGCNDNEADCPMVLYASTVANDVEAAINWLH